MDAVFGKFEQIKELEVTFSKLNPPLGGKVEKVTIKLVTNRDQPK
jgi:dihydroneopterin aldolase